MIHIVEDDSGVADAIAVLLGQMGHLIRAHTSAESVFDGTPPGPSDTVIVDLSLPGIDGGTLVRWLTSLAEPPRVLVITGQFAHEIDSALIGIDNPVLLRKPIHPATLAQLVGDALSRFPAQVADETCEVSPG